MDSKVEYIEGIFVCTSFGDAEAEAVAGVIDTMLSHANWKPGTPRCYDISNLKTGSLSVNDIKRIVGIAKERKAQVGTGIIAIVASRDLEYGLARMLCAYLARVMDSEIQVFRLRDEAIAWLSA